MSDYDEVRATDIVDGPETKGVVATKYLKARDLTDEHVGRFIGCNRDGVNYQAKILSIKVYETGKAPGVSLLLRHGAGPSWDSYDEKSHVPFDTDFELIELAAI